MLAFTGERLRFCGFVRQASSFLGVHRLPCALSESCLTRRARTRVQLSIVLSRRSEIFRFPKRKKRGGKKNERMQKRSNGGQVGRAICRRGGSNSKARHKDSARDRMNTSERNPVILSKGKRFILSPGRVVPSCCSAILGNVKSRLV